MNGVVAKVKNAKENAGNEFYLTLFLVATISYSIVTSFVNSLVGLFLPNTPIDTAICIAAYCYLLIRALPTILPRIKIEDVFLLFLFLLLFGISMFDSDIYPYAVSIAPTFFFQVFPLFVLGRSVVDDKSLIKMLQKATPWVIILAALYYFLALFVYIEYDNANNMAFAYYLLPFTIVSLLSFFEKRTVWNILSFALAFIIQLLTGTRGPLLGIVVAVLLYVAFQKTTWKTKTFVGIICALSVAYFMSDLFLEHMVALSDMLENIGMNNRIVDKLLEEGLTDDSGRAYMYATVSEAVQSRPVLGYGFLGDRVLLNGSYSHSIFYEILCHFGIVVGFLIFAFIVLAQLKALKKRSNIFLLVLVVCGFVKLFVSSSYILEPMFFLLMGYCLNKNLNENTLENKVTS